MGSLFSVSITKSQVDVSSNGISTSTTFFFTFKAGKYKFFLSRFTLSSLELLDIFHNNFLFFFCIQRDLSEKGLLQQL